MIVVYFSGPRIYRTVLHTVSNVETNLYYGKKKLRRRAKKVNDPDENRNSLKIHMLILVQYFYSLRKMMYNSLPRGAYAARSPTGSSYARMDKFTCDLHRFSLVYQCDRPIALHADHCLKSRDALASPSLTSLFNF